MGQRGGGEIGVALVDLGRAPAVLVHGARPALVGVHDALRLAGGAGREADDVQIVRPPGHAGVLE